MKNKSQTQIVVDVVEKNDTIKEHVLSTRNILDD